MEPMWNKTSAFIEIFQGTDLEPLRINISHTENMLIILTDFQNKMKLPEFFASKLIMVQIPVHPLLNSKAKMTT